MTDARFAIASSATRIVKSLVRRTMEEAPEADWIFS
jgi:hypothetical protein